MDQNLFTIHSVKVPILKYGETIPLYPFGDIHRDSPNCHVPKWQEFLSEASKPTNGLYIGMGDYLDCFSESERSGLIAAKLHESSEENMENFIKSKLDAFCEEIEFMRGKLIGFIEGNHFYKFASNITSTQYLCEKMKCRYLGASAFIRLSLEYHGHSTSKVDMFVHHGKGASRLVGGSLNTVQQMAECAVADVYLMGHDHKKSAGMSSRLELTDGSSGVNLRERRLLYARTGSFLKSYEPDRASYVVKSLLNPSDIGYVKIEITPVRKQRRKDGGGIEDRVSVNIHASI